MWGIKELLDSLYHMVVQRLYLFCGGEVLMQPKAQRNVTPECVVLAYLVRVLAVVCVALLASGVARPQGSSGRILGVVTDQSGGNVGEATVTSMDVARGGCKTLTTDSDGRYVEVGRRTGRAP